MGGVSPDGPPRLAIQPPCCTKKRVKMIIAVDFDGTLYAHGRMNAPLIENLKQNQAAGNTVILWTCREGKSLREAIRMLNEAGFAPHWINRNAPEGIRRMGHDSRKIFADVYIDDKAMR